MSLLQTFHSNTPFLSLLPHQLLLILIPHADLEGFWDNARLAADLTSEVPLGRWDIDRAYSPQIPPSGMTIYARHGAFCGGMECFDAGAFRMSRPEAIATDPQQRLLMERLALAVADASATGVTVGSSTGGWPSNIPCSQV